MNLDQMGLQISWIFEKSSMLAKKARKFLWLGSEKSIREQINIFLLLHN